MNELSAWIQDHATALWWLAGFSLLAFVGTLIAVPILIVRIPTDYFVPAAREKTPWGRRHPLVRAGYLVLKNLLGGIFVLVGIAMLVLPGQGLLTMVIGLMLIDFPGKFRLERWLVSRPPLLRTINWLRHRAGRPPIELS